MSQVSPAVASPNTPGRPDASTASDTPDTPGAEGGRRPRERDAFFDNAKFLAIVLVVVGHSWEGLRDGSRAVAAGYLLLYAFHMPAFTIVSGHFSRSFSFRPRQIRRLVTGVAVPYVVFETALNLFRAWNTGEEPRITLLHPWYLTWFLMALFIWRLTAPLWRALRYPFTVSVVLAAAATASPDIGGDLALQRVLQYLPFFVLGLRLEQRHFEALRDRRLRLLAPSRPRTGRPGGLLDRAPDEPGLVLPPLRGPGARRPRLGRGADDAGDARLLPAAERRLPEPDALPAHLVHGAGRRDAVRVPAARLPGQGGALLGLVRGRLREQRAGCPARHRGRGRGGRGPDHAPGGQGLPLGDGAATGVVLRP
ncbi:acyltransferase family protein [Streptomyces radiopugnans]|nr:acyltransferase family protein [Streptomyces radiopugnans]